MAHTVQCYEILGELISLDSKETLYKLPPMINYQTVYCCPQDVSKARSDAATLSGGRSGLGFLTPHQNLPIQPIGLLNFIVPERLLLL